MAFPIWTGTSSSQWTTTTNWSTSAVPTTGDTAYLTSNAVNIDPSLAQPSGTAIVGLFHDMSYTGLVGNATGTATYLNLNAATYIFGQSPPNGTVGTGSGRLNFNAGSTSVAVDIFNSATQGSDAGFPPIRLLGTALTINALGGIFGVATLPSESATIASLIINNAATCFLGPAVTLSSMNIQAGNVYSYSTITAPTETVGGTGTYYVNGVQTHTALMVQGPSATVVLNASGTVTNCTNYGTVDLSQGIGTVTFTNKVLMYANSSWIDPFGRAVFSAGYEIVNGDSTTLQQFTVGYGRTYTVT